MMSDEAILLSRTNNKSKHSDRGNWFRGNKADSVSIVKQAGEPDFGATDTHGVQMHGVTDI